ncbi:phytanoyl-CoA dioxygenase family protein [Allokutzneria sp. A3M-2-11 16]|uniref:phytanoyl-CoA dioxygenase family protein n=1 Tax=Allokutzneria sp. A3M-2-11 16 TaxID=2962043 RepID=UPI0020B669EA|nr:phytanoyl-CoA dioxygenase family protein [Allokutzneria sp. A3M-2-11 16]MCP3803404.1 phytanoyl-CoA dioxygenase family protein [Allokutzneria sp. A3M-2-11 16]
MVRPSTFHSAALFERRPYHLSEEEVDFFDGYGYLILRKRIPDSLLSRLQDATASWIARGEAAAPDDPWRSDFKYSERPGGRVMYRVDYLHDKEEPATLELLGSPAMLGIVESLSGPNFVPTYEAVVFKNEGEGVAVEWHQDAVHPRKSRIYNVGVYLDSARKGEGEVRVLPGSQHGPADVCQVGERHGWNPPGVVQAELEPGDVLIHDVMVVHGSQDVVGNALRRTIYYEFRPVEQILAEGPWDRDWVDKRLRLLRLGISAYADAHPDAEAFHWNAPTDYRPAVTGDLAEELRVVHTAHTPGSYCSAGSVVPAKIRR